MIYIVTYDLNKEIKRPPMAKEIKSICNGDWARLSESSYAINTGLSEEQVFSRLEHMVDSNDNLYVVTIKRPWRGWGQKDVNQWMDRNLIA